MDAPPAAAANIRNSSAASLITKMVCLPVRGRFILRKMLADETETKIRVFGSRRKRHKRTGCDAARPAQSQR
jgi:hypothetical protein